MAFEVGTWRRLVDRGRELGIFRSGGATDQPVISTENFESIGKILLSKLLFSVEDGTLKDAPFFFDIARAWSHLDSPDRVREWLKSTLVEDPEFMRKLGLGLLTYSVGSSGKAYSFRDRPDAPYYDVGVMLEAGKAHLQKQLTPDQRAVITEIVRGAEQMLKPNDQTDQKQST